MAVKIVDIEACTGCGACTEVCLYEVLEVRDEKIVIVQPDECVECGACADECPNEVLEVEEEE
ncbi:MAG: 4Fe-4S binding protein [Planctomycetota bacterium]|nr:4Fe-4S binding protein [Planctomycetota bacterium]